MLKFARGNLIPLLSKDEVLSQWPYSLPQSIILPLCPPLFYWILEITCLIFLYLYGSYFGGCVPPDYIIVYQEEDSSTV